MRWKGRGINLQWHILKIYRKIYRKILTGEAIRRGLKRKPKVKRSFGRHKLRWNSNIEIEFEKVSGRAWAVVICLRQGEALGCFEHGNEQ